MTSAKEPDSIHYECGQTFLIDFMLIRVIHALRRLDNTHSTVTEQEESEIHGSVESAECGGIGRHNQGIEAGECCCAEDTLLFRETAGLTRSKAY